MSSKRARVCPEFIQEAKAMKMKSQDFSRMLLHDWRKNNKKDIKIELKLNDFKFPLRFK